MFYFHLTYIYITFKFSLSKPLDVVGRIDCNAWSLWAVSRHSLSCSSSKSLNHFRCQLGEIIKNNWTTHIESESESVPTSTTPNVVTVKLILLFSPMLGRTCWTTGVFSTIPDDQICTNIMTVSSSFWNSTQTYVDMLHQQIHIRVHRHTEMNQWCSHRHSGLGKGLSDWPLPPNTRQHLCTSKTGSYES